jgi:DNA-binding transcriptional ArsR family regulator
LSSSNLRYPVAGAAFEIEGADGETIAIAPGEYYFNTKARARRMMTDPLKKEGRQVYACLELGTMGFKRETAVEMERGKERWLTSSDIAYKTGLAIPNVRRGLVELEEAGLAERRSDDGGPLRPGHIVIHSWAVPREPKSANSSRPRLHIPSSFPQSWEPLKALIRKLKLSLPEEVVADDYLLAEGERLAADYQNLQKAVENLIERVHPRPPSYKEERTERTIERNISATAALPTQVEQPTKEEEAPPPPRYANVYLPLPERLIAAAQETLSEYGYPERHELAGMVSRILTQDAHATPEQLIAVIKNKAKGWKGPGLMFFYTYVPQSFPVVFTMRAPAEAPIIEETTPDDPRRYEDVLADDKTSEEEKSIARRALEASRAL